MPVVGQGVEINLCVCSPFWVPGQHFASRPSRKAVISRAKSAGRFSGTRPPQRSTMLPSTRSTIVRRLRSGTSPKRAEPLADAAPADLWRGPPESSVVVTERRAEHAGPGGEAAEAGLVERLHRVHGRRASRSLAEAALAALEREYRHVRHVEKLQAPAGAGCLLWPPISAPNCGASRQARRRNRSGSLAAEVAGVGAAEERPGFVRYVPRWGEGYRDQDGRGRPESSRSRAKAALMSAKWVRAWG